MGLFSWFKKTFQKEEQKKARILILGLDNAGKTSCLKRFSDEQIDHIMPTQGFNIKKLKENGFDATIWDIGGQKSIRPYWRNYYDETDSLIFVIDCTDRRRVEEAGIELKELLKDEKLAKVPLLVLANKQDLAAALPAKQISEKMLLSTIRNRAWSIQPCSAKTGDGLKEGLLWCMQNIKR